MARKPQVGLNLPPDAFEWFLDFEVQHHCTKTQIGVAGLIALAGQRGADLDSLLSVARWVDQGLVTWEEATDYAFGDNRRRPADFLKLSEVVVGRHHAREKAALEVEEAASKPNRKPRHREA